MGTYIEYEFQKKSSTTPKVTWVAIDDKTIDVKGDEVVISDFIKQDYLLFSILAGVRNGIGAGGSYSNEPVTPIAELRGLPKDLEGLEEIFIYDGHSYSYLESSEILEYLDKGVNITSKGLLNKYEVVEWNGISEPDEVYGGTVTDNLKVLDIDEYAASSDELREYDYFRVSWIENEDDHFSGFYDFIKALHDKYDGVRMVFGFD